MGAVIADPLAQALVATVGILLLVIAARDRILLHLDAWILPETADQRQALADAAGALAQAERSTTVGETVTRTVRRGCGAPATLLVADDAETRAGGFSAPQARIVPLSRQTAIVHLLETAGGPVRVEPAGRSSVFRFCRRCGSVTSSCSSWRLLVGPVSVCRIGAESVDPSYLFGGEVPELTSVVRPGSGGSR